MMLRSALNLWFAFVLFASVTCSVAWTASHADNPIAETADDIQPLVAGDLAPRFMVETVDGETFDFNPEELERPAVILAFRGGWCPYCNYYLSDMRHVIPEMREMGIDVMFLSGDRSELLYEGLSMQAQSDIEGLDYQIYSDANAQAAIAFGIAFRAAERTVDYVKKKGDGYPKSSMERHGVLPVPAVYAIGRDGVIEFAYVNADYKVRLPADELMQVARELATD